MHTLLSHQTMTVRQSKAPACQLAQQSRCFAAHTPPYLLAHQTPFAPLLVHGTRANNCGALALQTVHLCQQRHMRCMQLLLLWNDTISKPIPVPGFPTRIPTRQQALSTQRTSTLPVCIPLHANRHHMTKINAQSSHSYCCYNGPREMRLLIGSCRCLLTPPALPAPGAPTGRAHSPWPVQTGSATGCAAQGASLPLLQHPRMQSTPCQLLLSPGVF